MIASVKKIVNIHQAKTELSRLIADVLAGEEVVIAKAGKPLVKLTPARKKWMARKAGSAKGEVWISSDFDAPLPDEILNDFES